MKRSKYFGCQVTDSPEHVVNADMLCADSDVAKHVYSVLRRVVRERDEQFEQLLLLQQERNYYMAEAGKHRSHVTPPPSLEKHHLARELQECRNQMTDVSEQL